MARKKPNPLQKLVRGAIRDWINQANSSSKGNQSPNKSQKRRKASTDNGISSRSRYIPPSVRVSVLHRDGSKCVFCGRTAKQIELEIDHIIPFSKGGSNDLSNLQTLCIDCNRGKGSRILD